MMQDNRFDQEDLAPFRCSCKLKEHEARGQPTSYTKGALPNGCQSQAQQFGKGACHSNATPRRLLHLQ